MIVGHCDFFVILHFWKAGVEVSSFLTFQASDIKMAEIKLQLDLFCCALCALFILLLHYFLSFDDIFFLFLPFSVSKFRSMYFSSVYLFLWGHLLKISVWIFIGVLPSLFWHTVLESSQQWIENAIQSISPHGFLSNYGASS